MWVVYKMARTMLSDVGWTIVQLINDDQTCESQIRCKVCLSGQF